MTTRGDFVTQVRSELRKKALSAGTIVQFMNQSIEHYKGKRFTFNTVLNETLGAASGDFKLSFDSFSTSLIEVDTFDLIRSSSRHPLTQRPLQFVNEERSAPGYKSSPNYYAVYGNQVVFDVVLDQSYDFETSFHKELSAMASDNAQNAWVNEGLELIKTRTKRLLLSQYIRGPEAQREALEIKIWEDEAYRSLRSRLSSRESSGAFTPYGPGVPARRG